MYLAVLHVTVQLVMDLKQWALRSSVGWEEKHFIFLLFSSFFLVVTPLLTLPKPDMWLYDQVLVDNRGKPQCCYIGLVGEMNEFTSARSWRFYRSSTIKLVVLKGKKKSYFRGPNLSFAFPFRKRRFVYPA